MKRANEPQFKISRRTLLAGAAIGATQIAAPFVITARAAEAIKIGLLLPKSGPYAVQGETGSERRADRRRGFWRACARSPDRDRLAR